MTASTVKMAWVNHVDMQGVTLTASSEIATLPVSNLLTPHIAKKWRSQEEGAEGGDHQIDIDFGISGYDDFETGDPVTDIGVDVVALIGVNMTRNARIRLEASRDPSFESLEYYYDFADANVDPRFKIAVVQLPSVVIARYWRIYVTDSIFTLEAGRLVMARCFQPAVNFTYGYQIGYVDLSRVARSRGGQQHVDEGNSYRQAQIQFDFLTELEAFESVLELDRVAGLHDDILVILEPYAANIGQKTIWGLVSANSPIIEPNFGIYNKSYSVEERL